MKKMMRIVMVVVLTMSMLCSCGTTAGDTKKPDGVIDEMADVADTHTSSTDVVGTYHYQEEAMGGKLIVDWTLELKEDGTYALTEADHSCKWILDGDTCEPVNAGNIAVETELSVPKNNATYSGVSYASNSGSQICDIYLPEGKENCTVIIVYHGGGFMFGDQAMDIIQPIIGAALAHGYAVVSADYRKASEAAFPAAVADAKSVVRFVKAKADEYGFDAEHIVVWGESAGAYLASMTALTPGVAYLDSDVTDYADQDETVSALVDFYGPIEFYTMDEEYKAMGQESNIYVFGWCDGIGRRLK